MNSQAEHPDAVLASDTLREGQAPEEAEIRIGAFEELDAEDHARWPRPPVGPTLHSSLAAWRRDRSTELEPGQPRCFVSAGRIDRAERMLQRGESAASVVASTGLQPPVAQVLAEEVHARHEAAQLEWTKEAKQNRVRLELVAMLSMPGISGLPEGMLCVAEDLRRVGLLTDAQLLAEFAITMLARWRYLFHSGKQTSSKAMTPIGVLQLLRTIDVLSRQDFEAVRDGIREGGSRGIQRMIQLGWYLADILDDLGRDGGTPGRSFAEAKRQYPGQGLKGGAV